jgi:S1-C subfamily serine protease
LDAPSAKFSLAFLSPLSGIRLQSWVSCAKDNRDGQESKIAIAVGAALRLAAGLFLYFHRPPKLVRIHQRSRITEFVGMGIALRMDVRTHAVIVQQVIPHTPAAAAGITGGLMICKVDDVLLEGKSLAECVNLIRGPVGTTVKLESVTSDKNQTNTVVLTRQKFKL